MQIDANDDFIRHRLAGRTEQVQGRRAASGSVDNEIGCEGFLPPIGIFIYDACDHGAIRRSDDLEHPASRAHRHIRQPLGLSARDQFDQRTGRAIEEPAEIA